MKIVSRAIIHDRSKDIWVKGHPLDSLSSRCPPVCPYNCLLGPCRHGDTEECIYCEKGHGGLSRSTKYVSDIQVISRLILSQAKYCTSNTIYFVFE